MKNLFLLIGILAAIAMFSSCEQDSLTGDMAEPLTEETTGQSAKQQVNYDETNAEALVELDIASIETSELESRSTLIYETVASVSEGNFFSRWMNVADMSSDYRYILKVTPLSGDPDAMIYGRNSSNSYRLISESMKPSGVDQTSVTKNEFRSDESRAYFSVYGFSAARFRMQIFRERISSNHCDGLDVEYEYDSASGLYIITVKYSGNCEISWVDIENAAPISSCPPMITTCGTGGTEFYFQVSDPGTYNACATITCNGSTQLCCKEFEILPNQSACQIVRSENFESYRPNAKISPQSNDWTTWEPWNEGGSQDAFVRWFGGSKTLRLADDRIEDVIYKLGNKNNGRYELSWKMKMENGTGYFNIQRDQNNVVGGGQLQVKFNEFGQYKVGVRRNGQLVETNWIQYTNWQWVSIKLVVDFNTGEKILTVAGREINLSGSLRVDGLTSMGAINFYATNGSNFYVDDILMKECN